MIYCGDSLEVLKTLPENSVDAVVTDPPYGWRFMGKAWDGADIEKMFKRDRAEGDNKLRPAHAAGKYDLRPSANQSFQSWTEAWAPEALRVLKPGGHMLCFCGPRTYHRMASGVENAGFEIRDQLQWIFGSGFPKSHDVSKGIDKAAGAEREVIGTYKIPGHGKDNVTHGAQNRTKFEFDKTSNEPVTDDAIKWQGFGTALKPSNEPIVLARKPLSESTVAKNVLKWGVGALNIDASRIEATRTAAKFTLPDIRGDAFNSDNSNKPRIEHAQTENLGRWPANVIFDEGAAAMLDAQSGVNKSTVQQARSPKSKGAEKLRLRIDEGFADSGGASRFFYCAKASKSERNRGLSGAPKKFTKTMNDGIGQRHHNEAEPNAYNANNHPTVKPIKLMEYLCRLITPPGGTVLDPFMGSGSTGVACKHLGLEFIGIEMNQEYVDIAKRRIENIEIQGELNVRRS